MPRDTARLITIFGLNAGALLPVLFFLAHMRWWTAWLAVGGIVFFGVLQWQGLTVIAALRRVRCKVVGGRRPGVPAHKQRGFA